MAPVKPIRFSGLDLQDAMRAAAHASSRTALEASETAAELVVGKARQMVPRGPSGGARASLKAIGGKVEAGGSRAPYFGWLDFGGRTGISRSVDRRYIQGGRYLWPALGAQTKTITQAMEEALERMSTQAGLEAT